MARTLTDEEIAKLLAMPEKEANKWIDANIPGFADSIEAKKALIQRRQYAADNPIPGFDSSAAMATLGVGAGVSAVAMARLTELVKGSTTTYEAVLVPGELRERLRTVLGSDFFLTLSGGQFIAITRDNAAFCQIRLAVSESLKKTDVTISGLDLTEVKQGAGGVVDGLLALGKKAVSGRGGGLVGDVLDIATTAIDTAKDAGSALVTANAIADVIEKYGAEEEKRLTEVDQAERQKTERIKELRLLYKTCQACGQGHGGEGNCPSCGAPTKIEAVRQELKALGVDPDKEE